LKHVGVFDSGVGGLSVLRALRAELPSVRFTYLADSLCAPYGERGADWVARRSHAITDWLRQQDPIDALVVACNTATALAIDGLRAGHADLPIVGVEPAIKPAIELSRSGHVGVLATRGTLGSGRYLALRQRLLGAAERPLHIHDQPCDGLARAIEQDDADSVARLGRQYVEAVRRMAPSLDTLVLGCTHYPFAADILQAAAGATVRLVDTGEAVARRTRHVLQMHLPGLPLHTESALLTTGVPDALSAAAHRWLGWQRQARQVVVPGAA
jgi:glutamate racemase